MNAVLIILKLASTLLILTFLFGLYWIFDNYDWNYPLHKLGCFSALFLVIAGSQFLNSGREATSSALWAETGVLTIVLAALFFVYIREYHETAFRPPVSDIGFTTVHAVKMLVDEHENPYSSREITVRIDLDLGYRGFHYGPVMILGYLPVAFLPDSGYKYISLFYLLVSVVLLVLLVSEPEESWPRRLANVMFVLTAYFLAKRFWHEILLEGANDLFHVMFILAALLAFKKDRVFWTGLFTGLSFASKFAPAMFLMPFLPVRKKHFWVGFGLGLTPILPFVFWDPGGVFRNAFWLRVVIPPDWTSLYWITPSKYHWVFGGTLLVAFLAAVWWGIRRDVDYRSALVGFTLLLIVADVTQKQIHGNHLIWFYPLFALLFMYDRERLLALDEAPAV